MEKELVVNSTPTNVEIALLEDRKLVELHTEKSDVHFSVGDIFLGNIKMLRPGLNAAFLDVGERKDAFLHYTDLGPQINSVVKYTNKALNNQMTGRLLDDFTLAPDNDKNGKIDRVFDKKQNVLVQILKEPIYGKFSVLLQGAGSRRVACVIMHHHWNSVLTVIQHYTRNST